MAEGLDYDVAVVGGGPVGLAAALECAKAGKRVLLLERFTLFNACGSSGDYMRMFRVMYTEPYMADLALAAKKTWQKLEQDSGQSLVLWTGLLNFGDPNYSGGPEGNLTSPIENMKRLGLSYQQLGAAEIEARYAFTNLPPNYIGVFSPDCGIINVPLAARTLQSLGVKRGVVYEEFARVTNVDHASCEGSVTVTYQQGSVDSNAPTSQHEVRVGKVIVTCGAYTNSVLEPLGCKLRLDIWEMVYAYFSVSPQTPKALFPSMWFQFAEDEVLEDGSKTTGLFYGFPPTPWGPPNMVRVAPDDAKRRITDPSQRRPGPSEEDLAIVQRFIEQHMHSVTTVPNLAGSCLQTNVEDNNFVLDFVPGTSNKVVVFCAGWAMKFVPLLGEILSQLALEGHTKYDISHFRIDRPGVLEYSPLTPTANGSAFAARAVAAKPVRKYGGSAWPAYSYVPANGGH